MTEAVMEKQEQKTAFASRNANDEKIKQEEEELKNLIDLNKEGKPASTSSEDDSSLSAEEKTFKKRYGDLRSHSQKQQVQLQKELLFFYSVIRLIGFQMFALLLNRV